MDTSQPARLDLLGGSWRLESEDGLHNLDDVQLPAQVLQLLHQAGLVEDPLAGWSTIDQGLSKRDDNCLQHQHRDRLDMWRRRFNEDKLKWVAETTWILTRQLLISNAFAARSSIELLLDGYVPHPVLPCPDYAM